MTAGSASASSSKNTAESGIPVLARVDDELLDPASRSATESGADLMN